MTARERWWDKPTRLLHFGLASVVSLQLLNSLVIEAPEPGEPLTGIEAALFEMHEWLGMTALLIVLAHWAWSAWGAGGAGMRHLFPWRAADRAQLWRETRELLALRMPPSGPTGKLAGLTHALGMLAVTGSALTGAVLFFWMPESGKLNLYTGAANEAHEVIATFVWIYWIGHVGMAVLHQLWKHDGALRNMFSLKTVE